MLTAEQLYETYEKSMLSANIGIDRWHELSEEEQTAWKSVAQSVNDVLDERPQPSEATGRS